MLSGGGKNKGSEFEREVGKELSLWISGGRRNDLTSRTDCSGGRFTYVGKGNPGDLSASDPEAFPFFAQVLVECKHWKNIELMDFILKKGELYAAHIKNAKQAKTLDKFDMLIARQNFRPTLVICPTLPLFHELPLSHTLFHQGTFLGKFADFLTLNPTSFLKSVEVYLRSSQFKFPIR